RSPGRRDLPAGQVPGHVPRDAGRRAELSQPQEQRLAAACSTGPGRAGWLPGPEPAPVRFECVERGSRIVRSYVLIDDMFESLAQGASHPAVAAWFGLGAAAVAAVGVAMAWSVNARQIRLAELPARRPLPARRRNTTPP